MLGRSALLFYFSWKILLANTLDPDQTPHRVASELGLPMTFYRFPGKNGLNVNWWRSHKTVKVANPKFQIILMYMYINMSCIALLHIGNSLEEKA